MHENGVRWGAGQHEREPAGVFHPLLMSLISWGRAISGKEMLQCEKC